MAENPNDPLLKSWVESANVAGTDFPVQNLPFGVFARSRDERPRIGIAIGSDVLDLDACAHGGLLDALDAPLRHACRSSSLNALFALGRSGVRAVRERASEMLRADTPDGARTQERASELLVHSADCVFGVPVVVGDYSDFYASIHHATNVGSMFRPDSPLLPNYKWIPIGYHGRASSIVANGATIVRPSGQARPDPNAPPVVGPSRMLDYELEIAAIVGPGNELGSTIPLAQAEAHIIGLCLLNDWSARDIQSWEYQPLGPFLGKSFATTLSPWVVTLDALDPFRVARAVRPGEDPAPLAYLEDDRDRTQGAFDITLEVWLQTAAMRTAEAAPVRLSRGSFKDLYWTMAQMLAHHASNGCNLRTGDVIASGTVSGPTRDSRGCLLELTWRGKEPIQLPNGETRTFLDAGDLVELRGYCESPGATRIGFGACTGTIT